MVLDVVRLHITALNLTTKVGNYMIIYDKPKIMTDGEVMGFGRVNMVLVYVPDSNNIEANSNTVLGVL